VLTAGRDTIGAVMHWPGGTCTRIEAFAADDDAGMLAALRRLQADGAAPPATSENP
jgi:hypothetical protein